MKKQINKNIDIANKLLDTMQTLTTETWTKGWTINPAQVGGFRNAKTNKIYTGVNSFILYTHNLVNKFKDTRYLTFKQCKEMGGNLQAGAKGVELLFYTEWDRNTKAPFDPNSKEFASLGEEGTMQWTKAQLEYYKEFVYLCTKTFWVFNVEQCTGLNLPAQAVTPKKIIQEKTNKFCETVIKNSTAQVYFDSNKGAFYTPVFDCIHLPARNAFNTIQDLYATAMHEIVHSTGHSSRLNRDFSGVFGTIAYAKEEFVAEFGAVMLQNQAGIELTGKPMQNSAVYIKSWAKKIREENKQLEFLKAIRLADKASQYICNNYAK